MLAWLAVLVALAGCHKAPAPPAASARVALWEVSNGQGPRAWLFGTVHALPKGVNWRSGAVDKALGAADQLVFEIGQPIDSGNAGAVLRQLGFTPGLPPPSQRIAPDRVRDLQAVYRKLGVDDDNFAGEESWAVALQLAAIGSKSEGIDPDNGVEPELRRQAAGKPVAGLETLETQFGAFDALPPRAQSTLLGEVAHEAATDADNDADMMKLWLNGDVGGIGRESFKGFLADPDLRTALLTARTARWAQQVDAMIVAGHRPFVAVGAAHVAGPDGLPALMARRGYTVRRIQ